MFLLRVLCVKLCILHLSFSQDLSCFETIYDDDITLIEVKTGRLASIYRELNEEFIRKCQDYYKINTFELDDNSFATTQDYINNQYYLKVINLFAESVHEYDQPPEHTQDDIIVFAGDIYKNESLRPELRETHNSSDPKCVFNDITETYDCYETVKLVSRNVFEMNSNDLFNFVSSIEFVNDEVRSRDSCFTTVENAIQLNKILLCVDTEPLSNVVIELSPLRLVVTTNCARKLKTEKENFVAILAPRPFEIENEYSLIPAYFYETLYLSEKDDETFVNAVPLVPWQMLKYAYLELIRSMGWRRVVILSDDSFHSIDFEYELTELFNKERIVYTVVRCEADFNVIEISKRLESVRATIIIANVEARNAVNLQYLKIRQGTIWLVRDLSMPTLKSFRRQNFFSVSLAPTDNNAASCLYNDMILNGLSRIREAYMKISESETESRKTLYRKLAEQMKNENPKTEEIIGFVHGYHYRPNVVLEVLINKDGVKRVNRFNNPFNDKISDGVNCIIRSYNYFHPCQDVLIIVFMFVIIMFTATLLLITCFFDKSSPIHDFRYRIF
ncbi:unnamed protein product [Chrysodeixis includens]|uniref:Receptor ligand binding region domain-containing protein n=1 Tax=Chrysodeixis includens TaxID=689277 RepID=A0A9P0BTX2_CHRIL|nr:unnamed protein product [Chrysodeixis includens]